MGPNGPRFFEVWNTNGAPATIDRFSVDPPVAGLVLTPPAHGTRIRVNEFPPESAQDSSPDTTEALKQFENIGGANAFTGGHGRDCPSPLDPTPHIYPLLRPASETPFLL